MARASKPTTERTWGRTQCGMNRTWGITPARKRHLVWHPMASCRSPYVLFSRLPTLLFLFVPRPLTPSQFPPTPPRSFVRSLFVCSCCVSDLRMTSERSQTDCVLPTPKVQSFVASFVRSLRRSLRRSFVRSKRRTTNDERRTTAIDALCVLLVHFTSTPQSPTLLYISVQLSTVPLPPKVH